MQAEDIRFDDGAAYERLMGGWSQLAGAQFLDWLALPEGGRLIDVGCGNGAFTEQLVQRCRPASVLALDPSPGQLAYARTRLPAGAPVQWALGDALHLPAADASAEAALMALVLFFVPDPAAGLREMCRVVRPGGRVAAYHWDLLGGGFPLAAIGAEMLKIGLQPRLPPSAEVSTIEASTALWQAAGLQAIRSRSIEVERRFAHFDDYWDSAGASNTLRPMFESLSGDALDRLKANVRRRLGAEAGGSLSVRARATAICGIKA